MQALKVRRLSDSESAARYYLDGKRVSRSGYEEAHYGRDTDAYSSRMHTRKDGSIVVREFHFIRSK